MTLISIPIQNEEPITFKEAVAYLKLSKKTVTKLLSEGKIRGYKPTSKILIYKSQLIEDIQKLNYSTTANG